MSQYIHDTAQLNSPPCSQYYIAVYRMFSVSEAVSVKSRDHRVSTPPSLPAPIKSALSAEEERGARKVYLEWMLTKVNSLHSLCW